MLIWRIMIICGWFDGRDFSMDLTDSLKSLLELIRRKFKFLVIKCSKVDVSKILLSFCFKSLLESPLYQNLQILDIKFSASSIVPFTMRWRPLRSRCDSSMLSCKLMLFSSLFKIFMSLFSTLAAFLLSKRKIGEEIKMFLQFRWWVFISSVIFFIST